MLIRSNSKKHIYNFDNVIRLSVSRVGMNSDPCSCNRSRIIIETTDDNVAIAEYESEEIAMFVLNLFSKMYAACNGNDMFTFPNNKTAKELMDDPEGTEGAVELLAWLSGSK